ncbi:hypothetical protein V6N13_049402 [Hibiscus sabdariffa]
MKQWIYREKSEIEEISSVFRIIGETLSGLVAVTPHKGTRLRLNEWRKIQTIISWNILELVSNTTLWSMEMGNSLMQLKHLCQIL